MCLCNCLYVYVCIYIYIYIHTHLHVYMYMNNYNDNNDHDNKQLDSPDLVAAGLRCSPTSMSPTPSCQPSMTSLSFNLISVSISMLVTFCWCPAVSAILHGARLLRSSLSGQKQSTGWTLLLTFTSA